MGKIYYMMGKSSSGKDTLFREILEEMPQLKTVTLYTTRSHAGGRAGWRGILFCCGGHITII